MKAVFRDSVYNKSVFFLSVDIICTSPTIIVKLQNDQHLVNINYTVHSSSGRPIQISFEKRSRVSVARQTRKARPNGISNTRNLQIPDQKSCSKEQISSARRNVKLRKKTFIGSSVSQESGKADWWQGISDH